MKPTSDRALVSIYRSPRKSEMYLYVPKVNGLKDVPEVLLEHFGQPHHVMDMLLKRDRKLARVDTGRLLDQLIERGYYLQMPPSKDDYMLDLYREPKPDPDAEA
ncbi:YcgL domain-containing protein [Saccharospirillum salsuginis]|uniref:YcgL domain-containing protein GCM10007392_31400 n=1 Tax=Saccharospirillum salsuginis TaxID=418750 RepID=A0A918KF37_9GAMM|nr:YcgL domain-containing protein [Saccharospirillum salsuginis]GGX61093.1 YcgL domain-containing protein [Saccharospirillum salsuginis]